MRATGPPPTLYARAGARTPLWPAGRQCRGCVLEFAERRADSSLLAMADDADWESFFPEGFAGKGSVTSGMCSTGILENGGWGLMKVVGLCVTGEEWKEEEEIASFG